ncbi:MAG: hypothetical protein QG656_2606, partial [Candidatus Hydrogenedentes bacterium]|nr:hypothetical protein [Candidatus Hydrogenedentota bacterium]
MSATRLVKIGPENGGNFEYAWEGSYLRAHILSDIGKRRTHN